MANDLWDPKPRRVAVFRALQLGDMLCAVPALRALRAFLPHARITLVGLPWARDFVARYGRYVDDLLEFPGFPGYPEREGPIEPFLDALAAAQERRFDVAIQLHGSGGLSNRIVRLMGAERIAGFRPRGEPSPGPRFMPWPEGQNEVHRYLSLMAYLGVPLAGEHLEMPLGDGDWREHDAIAARHGLARDGFVVVHPGARLRSRRWPPGRFAEVAAALQRDGWPIVVTGSESERELTAAVLGALPRPGIDLTGATTLGGMAALLSRAALLVANDTGVSHVAAAVRAPSVIVASGSDVRRWRPLDGERHAVLWHDLPCRPCAHEKCPTAHECAMAVTAEAAIAEARRHLPSRDFRHAA